MDLMRKLSSAVNLRSSGGHHDDWVDRLNWKVTGATLLCFTLVVTTQQYVGDPINCWCPKEYPKKWISWTNKFCWIKNTYYIEIDDPIPKDEDLKPQLLYYQWMPFILLFQAFLFYVPSLLWSAVTHHVGISLDNFTEAGKTFSLASKVNDRDETVKHIAGTMNHFLGLRRKRYQSQAELKLKIMCSKRKGNLLVFCYLLIKLVYLGNIIGQFFLLNALLGTSFSTFGSDIVYKLREGHPMDESRYFPRVSLCDFVVRGMGNILRSYTVECVLTINLFNEKIFIFLWFWFCLLAVVTGLSFIRWLLTIVIPPFRRFYVRRYLVTAVGKDFDWSEKNRRKFDEFTGTFLRDDGVFILRMLDSNATDLVTVEVVKKLWETYDVNVNEDDPPETFA